MTTAAPYTWHIAEVNLATIQASYDDPRMTDFVDGLARINAQAEAASGFVWRLKTIDNPPGKESEIFGANVIVNMSVWQSIEHLTIFTYTGEHLDFYRRRSEWMIHTPNPYMAMWYVRPGTRPTLQDAKHRLDHIQANGISEYAFTFRQRYPAPAAAE